MNGSRVSPTTGTARAVLRTAMTIPTIASAKIGQISIGNNSSHVLRGDQAISAVSPKRASRGSAQKPATANPANHVNTTRPTARRHTSMVRVAITITIVVMMWLSAVRPRTSAATGRSDGSSLNPRMRSPK